MAGERTCLGCNDDDGCSLLASYLCLSVPRINQRDEDLRFSALEVFLFAARGALQAQYKYDKDGFEPLITPSKG